jgi:hypothetical protein
MTTQKIEAGFPLGQLVESENSEWVTAHPVVVKQ